MDGQIKLFNKNFKACSGVSIIGSPGPLNDVFITKGILDSL